MNTIVIYPGRFHPFHRGHKSSYDYLVNRYGSDSVYVATTDVQAPVTSPFSYTDKVAMMTQLGIPSSHIVRVKNPYQANEIVDSLSDEERANTALIFAVSAKDSERFNFAPKKDGTASYLQPVPKNPKEMKPLTEHAYIEIVPTVDFKINGKPANSASEIRKLYIEGNDIDRAQIIADLYGEPYPQLKDIFDRKLERTKQVQEYINEAKSHPTTSRYNWLRRVLTLEQQANEVKPLTESKYNIDYIDEKNHRHRKLT